MDKSNKFVALTWPDYQDYMDHPDFDKSYGYDPIEDTYYIPLCIINDVDIRNMKTKIDPEFLQELDQMHMMYLTIATLFSIDTLTSKKKCDESIDILKKFINVLPKTNIDQDKVNKYIKYCNAGIDICKMDKYEIFHD